MRTAEETAKQLYRLTGMAVRPIASTEIDPETFWMLSPAGRRLVVGVLAHFITAVTLGARGKRKSRHFKLIRSVICHVVLIVFLVKAMFFIAL